ncbi:hypothetical protein, partial [Shigella boydii]|uniref:hypothetical protein n=1 Tax=Shigella boydii TaxID=621 RepID=UPI002541D6B9
FMNRHSSDLIELLAQISRSHNAMSVSFSGDSSGAGGGGDWLPPARSLRQWLYMALHMKGAQQC